MLKNNINEKILIKLEDEKKSIKLEDEKKSIVNINKNINKNILLRLKKR